MPGSIDEYYLVMIDKYWQVSMSALTHPFFSSFWLVVSNPWKLWIKRYSRAVFLVLYFEEGEILGGCAILVEYFSLFRSIKAVILKCDRF